MSHPSRVRGLKPEWVYPILPRVVVAPFTGAWIETPSIASNATRNWRSHPSRVRGLKLEYSRMRSSVSKSHPSRVRGLKLQRHATLFQYILSHPSRVRGLKLASVAAASSSAPSHPSRVRGLKPMLNRAICIRQCVAPFTGAWIETLIRPMRNWTAQSHPSRVRGLKLQVPSL